MKNLSFLILFLFLVSACDNAETLVEPKPSETADCLVQRIDYYDNTYALFKFDESKKLIQATLSFFGEDSVLYEWPVNYLYNSEGNLVKSTTRNGASINYFYDSDGILLRVEFKTNNGKIEELFTISMDGQKRITKVIAQASGLTGLYTYNGPQGQLTKIEIRFEGKVTYLYEVKSFETDKTKKSFDIVITGHPFNPEAFDFNMIYSPLNIKSTIGMVTSGTLSTSYDENWENLTDKIRVYMDYKFTRTFNENNFLKERTSIDLLSNTAFKKTIVYSNCK
ncbi:hypothetical protein EGI22_10455 [Lacihabitans sp. LS3-19]|uniref:hypothetical protein n=1 Tax=Lacihabitans sp. LS3-19 TaxID=2487335 RepID=UPI0020CE13E4|nr:hypothetical protein [Lacihabitans sp. LS3-19]MCP9768335.1 hypothetical protein [Lacihabitans sp. LS3-19]